MKSPFTGKEMSVVKEWRTMSFRKDEFKVLFHSYRCEDTDEQFEDDAFSQINYNQLVNQYRVNYSIPFPEQIREIREKYNISAIKMSEILGFGTNGYRQYENGDVPSQSNAKLIHMAEDPHEFRKLVCLCRTLDQKIVEKINSNIDDLLDSQKQSKSIKNIENYILGACCPSKYTGFKIPDIRKITAMIIYFTNKLEPWKTKLNKLLFYADFNMFSQTGFSMSGLQYRAIQMGPVPKNFDSIFEYLVNNNVLDILYIPFENGGVGEKFQPTPNNPFDEKLFSTLEQQLLNSVVEKFKNTSTDEIIKISHKEKAWIENFEGRKLIDYNYSFVLN